MFVIVAVLGYTQTRSFRTYLHRTILDASHDALNGQLQFGTIQGNLLTGFTIDSVSLAKDSCTAFSAERVELKYDPFGFIFKRVAISRITLIHPRILVYRSLDGSWNISQLVKPTPSDTNPSSWTIDIKKLDLRDATISFIDSLKLFQRSHGLSDIPPDSVVDYAHIDLSAFSMDAYAFIQHGNIEAGLRNLEFISHRPGFVLKHFEGDFLLTKEEVSARKVHIQTANSDLKIDVGLKKVDLTALSKLEELKMKPVDVSLTAEGIDTRELKLFLYPSVDFLDQILKLRLKASGTFGNLNIDRLAIQMPHSVVQLEGQLRNLHAPRNLEMTVQSNDNSITPHDLLDCLPGLNIPDLSFLGQVKYSFTYEGKPLDFKAHIFGYCAAGGFDVDGTMNLEKSNTLYAGTIGLKSVAAGTLLKDDQISSDLNAHMTVDGSGFNPRTMTGLMRMEIDSSMYNGLPVQHSVFVFDIADGILRSHVAAAIGSGTYEISNTMNFFTKDSTGYSIKGKIRSLDLAEALKEKRYESDLSFDLSAIGAMGTETRSDTIDLQFYRSSFGKEKFETAVAKAIYAVQDSQQSALQLTSTIADLDATGHFSPASFIAAWENSYRLVTEAIGFQFKNLDSLQSQKTSSSTAKNFQPTYVSGVLPIGSQFRMKIKDLRPFGTFIHIPLSGHGLIEGTISGDSAAMQLQGRVHVQQFGVRAGSDTITIDTARIQYSFGGVGAQTMLQTFQASLVPDVRDVSINGFLFNQLAGTLQVQADSSNFELTTLIDSTARVAMDGTTHMRDRMMDFIIPNLRIELGQYIAENSDTVQFTLGQDGFRIRSLTMIHESEEAILSGSFSPTGTSDMNVAVNGFLLSNLKEILRRGPYGRSSTKFGGRVDATSSFRGNFMSPNIVVDIKADGVRAEDVIENKSQVFGKVDSHLAYYDHMLNLLVKFVSRPDDPQAAPDLLLSGSLPYEFVLAREEPHDLKGQVDITLKAPRLDLRFLDPFIPEVSNLNGLVTCDMQIKGSYEAPTYAGSMSIQRASLVFDPVGIRYILNGNLVPTGDRIQFNQFTIQNDQLGRGPAGTIKIEGNFTLLGLKLKQFDIVGQGDLKVMTEDKRYPGQKLYGDLFAATGPRGLRWQGNLTSSLVQGELFVKEAALVLPPEREAELLRGSMVKVVFTDDTSHVLLVSSNGSEENNGIPSPGQLRNHESKNTTALIPTPETEHNSFLDGINYDVSIETKGSTTLRFVFNTQTSEELYADLQGRLYFNRTPEMSRLTGQVEVGNRSYYNFIKKFEASGKLLFTGDILNPELDVLATYKGIHHAVKQTAAADSTAHTGTSSEEQDEEVLVTLKVTGTRNEPKTKISLQTKTFSEKDWKKWEDSRTGRSDEEANAISFILSGQFRDELTDQQRMGLIGSNLGLALASGMVMGPLSEALRRNTWGYIQSVDVIYQGGQFDQSADLRLTGQIGNAVIRMGGRVLNDISNANVSVEVPVSSVVGSERYRNLILTLERRVEGIQTAEEQRRASNGARLFYRITF